AVGEGEERPEPQELALDLVVGDAPVAEVREEAFRPHLVDDVDDLRLLHPVVDKLRRELPLAGGDGVHDRARRRYRLVLPVARADPFAQLVRPGQLHDGRRTASGDRLRRPRGPAHALLTRLILLALTRSRRAANMAPEPLPVSIGP